MSSDKFISKLRCSSADGCGRSDLIAPASKTFIVVPPAENIRSCGAKAFIMYECPNCNQLGVYSPLSLEKQRDLSAIGSQMIFLPEQEGAEYGPLYRGEVERTTKELGSCPEADLLEAFYKETGIKPPQT